MQCSAGKAGLGDAPLSLLTSYLLWKSTQQGQEGPESSASSIVTGTLPGLPSQSCGRETGQRPSLKAFVPPHIWESFAT